MASFALEPLGNTTHWADGAGNCFWVFRLDTEWQESMAPSEAAIRSFCEKALAKSGKAADGILVVAARDLASSARMVIFNTDGSRPEACGNALRCVPRVLGWNGAPQDPWLVQTDSGQRKVWRSSPDSSEVSMGPVQPVERAVQVVVDGETFSGDVVSVGNPHFVLAANSVREARISDLGPLLATHPRFLRGTNVEFVFQDSQGTRVRVWERGVGETQACGTGACAVAVTQFAHQLESEGAELRLPGGMLQIGIRGGELSLLGPASAKTIPPSPLSGRPMRGTAPHLDS